MKNLLLLSLSLGLLFGVVPQTLAASQLLYQDSLPDGFSITVYNSGSAVPYNTSATTSPGPYSGSAFLEIGFNEANAGLKYKFPISNIDTSPFTHLEFYARQDMADTFRLKIEGPAITPIAVPLSTYVTTSNLSNTTWQRVLIPLSDLGAQYNIANKVVFFATTATPGNRLLIDEMFFTGDAPPPTPTPIPQTLTNTISVNRSNQVSTFRPEMLGVAHANWEHSWGKAFIGEIPGLGEVYNAAGIKLVRYAGGLWANSVGWDRTPQRRPYDTWNAVPVNYSSIHGPQVVYRTFDDSVSQPFRVVWKNNGTQETATITSQIPACTGSGPAATASCIGGSVTNPLTVPIDYTYFINGSAVASGNIPAYRELDPPSSTVAVPYAHSDGSTYTATVSWSSGQSSGTILLDNISGCNPSRPQVHVSCTEVSLQHAFTDNGVTFSGYTWDSQSNSWEKDWDRTVAKLVTGTVKMDRMAHEQRYFFHYGKDEIDSLGAFSKQYDIDVMIQVNAEDNDPAMWADMVRYTNIEHDYDFKYWELSNELDLVYERGNTGVTPEMYAERVATYTTAMKAVDPSIHIISGVSAGAGAKSRDVASGSYLDQYLLRSAETNAPDSLSYHWYQNHMKRGDAAVQRIPQWFTPDVDPNTGPFDSSFEAMHYGRYWSALSVPAIETVLGLQQLGVSKPYPLGITELNFDAGDFDIAPQNANHLNAVWGADVLGRLAYNGLDYVTWYEGYGNQGQGYPMIYPDNVDNPTRLFLRPSYYPFFMYGNFFGDQMLETTSDDEPMISAFASRDSTTGQEYMMVINFSENPRQATITYPGLDNSTLSLYTMSNPDPLNMTNSSHVENGGTTINGIILGEHGSVPDASTIPATSIQSGKDQFVHTFPAYTVTAVVIDDQSPPPSSTDYDGDGDTDWLDLQWVIDLMRSTSVAIFEYAAVVAGI